MLGHHAPDCIPLDLTGPDCAQHQKLSPSELVAVARDMITPPPPTSDPPLSHVQGLPHTARQLPPPAFVCSEPDEIQQVMTLIGLQPSTNQVTNYSRSVAPSPAHARPPTSLDSPLATTHCHRHRYPPPAARHRRPVPLSAAAHHRPSSPPPTCELWAVVL